MPPSARDFIGFTGEPLRHLGTLWLGLKLMFTLVYTPTSRYNYDRANITKTAYVIKVVTTNKTYKMY